MVLSVRSWLHHPLTHNVAFMHLWAGQTAAEIGFQVGALATSAIAISLLHASETQIGLLSALQTLAFLLVGLPAGAWVDRWRKRHVMIAANLTRITALTSIPLAYILSSLTPGKADLVRGLEAPVGRADVPLGGDQRDVGLVGDVEEDGG